MGVMETLESRLDRRVHASLYALIFLTMLLGISVLLEGCAENQKVNLEKRKVYQLQAGLVNGIR